MPVHYVEQLLGSPLPFRFHIAAQDRIDTGLVAASLGLEEIQHILVDAHRVDLFRRRYPAAGATPNLSRPYGGLPPPTTYA